MYNYLLPDMTILPLSFVASILIVFSLHVTRGEITNEIQQYVHNLLQEQNEEIRQLTEEIRALKGQMFSLQRSYQHVLKELNTMKAGKGEAVSTEYRLDEKVEMRPIHVWPSQSSAPVKAPGNETRQFPTTAQRIRGERSPVTTHSRLSTTGAYPTAFSASMSRSVSNIHHNQILVFDNALINNGNAYNTKSGIFTSNTKGVYLLSSTITTDPGKSLEAFIYRNGVEFCRVYSGDSTMYSAGSNMAILPLDVGDNVMMKIHDHFHESGVTIDGAFSSFSGYLLYETD